MVKRRRAPARPRHSLFRSLRELYEGQSRQAVRFQTGLLILDLTAIVFFIAASFLHHSAPLYAIEFVLAALFLVDYLARLSISDRRLAFVLHPVSLADLIVIVSLFTALLYENFAFLRVLRALRLLRTYRALAQLRRRYPFFAAHQEVFTSAVSLIVFIFVVTALVFVFQVNVNPQIENYVDALYYTVTTLTTTGFGDIILVGTSGRILAVLIMVLGLSLFLRLIQTLFRPGKVHFECPSCGLSRHDPDAVHCKHCGVLIKIETEGA
jgi:voltage-gated potassium channel